MLPILIGLPLLCHAATKTWDGGGQDTRWTNPLNWDGNTPPSAGDDLVFPTQSFLVTRNDFPAGTPFHSILITAYQFSVSSNLIALQAGLTHAGSSVATVTAPLRLDASQTFFIYSNMFTTLDLRSSVLDLNGFNLTIAGPGTVSISSTITGAGSLIKRGYSLTLAGSNTFSGPLRLEAGLTILNHPHGFGAPAGATEVLPGATLDVRTNGPIDEPLLLQGGARIIRGTWNGPVALAGPNVEFTFNTSINGPVSGAGGIALSGTTTILTFNGANTYAGTNLLTAGTFIVNGHQPSSEVYVAASSILAGIGHIGPITSVGGEIRPGTNSTAFMYCGNLNLANPGALVIEINGLAAGFNYDQLHVFGQVTLANGLLILSNTILPSAGQQLLIVNNDGNDAVVGHFGGLPEGEILSAGPARFRISYVGGDGNDVVLTAIALPPPPTGTTRVWDGGGANDLWSTAENWAGDAAPVQGDALEFPESAAQLLSVNDFAADTTFNSLRLNGAGYRLEGTRIALNEGISATHTVGVNQINLPLLLNTNQTFRTASAPLEILAAVATAGSRLTLENDGAVYIRGVLGGAGSIYKTHGGSLSLSAPNTLGGAIEITAGELIVSNALALGDPSHPTIIRTNALMVLHTGIGTERLTLDGRLRSVGVSPLSTNRIDGPIALTRLGVDLEVSNVLVINGAITGTGPLDKYGAGTAILNADNTYFNGGTLWDGTFVVNGSITNSPLFLVGGTLAGTGSLAYAEMSFSGNLSNTLAIVSPGLDQSGVLTFNHLADFNNGSRVAKVVLQLNGSRPGIDYDQLRIEGHGDVSNARLELSLGFTPQVGDRFVIVDKLSPYEVSQPFHGLRQGTVFEVGNTQFQISYRGGDSNDVELTVTEGLPLTRTWEGASTNRLWSDPRNWAFGVAPLPGDTLVFPRTPSQPINPTSTNDYPAGTVFRRLIFDGNWFLYGAPISVNVGILAYSSSTIAIPITLNSNLAFICDDFSSVDDPIVDLRGGIDLAGKELILTGSGKIRVRGQLQDGDVEKRGTGLVEFYTNNLHRHTWVREGELSLFHSNALASADFGTEVDPGAQLTLAIPNAVFQEPLLLGGTLAYIHPLISASNIWTGNISVESGANITTSNILLIAGVLQGTGPLTKNGPGNLMLMGDNTFSGTTVVNTGTLFVHGNHSQSPVFLINGTLLGRGTAGPVFSTNASARIDPGHRTVANPTDTAILSCGSLTVFSNTIVAFSINGPIAGVQHDQLRVAGVISLNRTRLIVQMRYQPLVGEGVILIDNDGTDPVSGTFGSLAEGAFVVQSNMLFQLSYAGGDGNDVTLTRLEAPESTLESIQRQTNAMVIQGLGISNLTYSVQATSNLNLPIFWETIGTSSANRSNIYQFIDTNSSLLPMRFYRVMSP